MAAGLDLPTFAEQGYFNAGHGGDHPESHPTQVLGRTRVERVPEIHDLLLRRLRGQGERGFTLLVGRWNALRPCHRKHRKPTLIVTAALACAHCEHGWSTDQTPCL
ncbi:hypothetical protein GCM10010428_08910 [Actinosynnema pretiosum subsp. pretiosum]